MLGRLRALSARALFGRALTPASARDSMAGIVDRMLRDLDAADPMSKAAQLERIVKLQAALIVDLRNRVAVLERG